MTSDPLDDVVSGQYERWAYPAPIRDLPGWLGANWQWFDPSHAHALMWPDRGYPEGLDILVAGCGTNQAAIIAYTNPSARVVAIDVSQASLDHHRWLADAYSLDNLQLHRMPIEDVASLGRDFDLIISTGVLHHMDDPRAGMRGLAERLRPEGVLAVMLYASFGRIGVQIMQSIFRDLGLRQDEASLATVRDAIGQLGPQHPLAGYLALAPDLGDDAGLVDTFLHGREVAYTIDECRDLVESAGLIFQDVFLKASYYAPLASTSPFLREVAALPREQQWSIMQRINATNACHYFLACRPERPADAYVIDFASAEAPNYVPTWRKGCSLTAATLRRHDWQVELSPRDAALVSAIDGQRSIEEILNAVLGTGDAAAANSSEAMAAALMTFQALWQGDFLAMGIR